MCLLFRKEIFHEVRFDESFDLYEDWDLLIRLAFRHTFSHIKKVTAGYNQNLVRQITSDSSAYRQAYVHLIQKHMKEITTDVLFYNWRMIIDGRELIKGAGEAKEDLRVLKRVMERKTTRIEGQERLIAEQQRLIEEQQRRIADLHILVNNMKTTLGWQMLESFRRFRDRLLTVGSKRRAYFELFIKSVKVLRTQGFSAFYHKARTKLQGSRHMNSRMARGARIGTGKAFFGKPVDIVIPVYNAYEDLKVCLTSVLNATDLTTHRLIVIDDRSTDPRMREYLDTVSDPSNGRQIVVLKNEKNLGFTRTANTGMRFSQRDVILLNSDTIVTEGWVENLREAAYSGPKVATVTPFSNNATICSIPLFCENNAIPAPFALDSFAQFIHRTSLRYYPEIPTGVGFCMYFKRDVLNEIGYFDEAAFERGYGEENDFCMRVIKSGYVNVLDDATYIYHRGGASFTCEVKTARENEALKILDNIHPEYLPMVNKFIQENPLEEIHNYLRMRIELERKNGVMSVCRTGLRET
jgi:GT2 family glycosyltransferase